MGEVAWPKMNLLSWFDTGKIKLHAAFAKPANVMIVSTFQGKKKQYAPTVSVVRFISLIP